jgi:glucose/mannose-6-phosphate isomerase
LCITTGGKIGEIAETNNVPAINIPSGLQPRCALGYSFFPMLHVVLKTGLLDESTIAKIKNEIQEVIELLQVKSKEYSEINEYNSALNLAKQIFGSIPLIYSSVDGMESVNTRWVRQIQENAKHLVFSGLLPEMNHNEISSFSYPVNIPKEISMIFIRDKNDHPKTQIRFNALASLTGNSVKQVIEVQSNANSLLARMFDMIYLGDWVSYYLAILSKVDPTPIPLITKLKNLLA